MSVQMRLRSLVFISFQGCPIFFKVDLIKCTYVGFSSKIHFHLSELSTSMVKIFPFKHMNLVPSLEFSIDL